MPTQLPFLVRKFEEREAAITANVLDTFRAVARLVHRGVLAVNACLFVALLISVRERSRKTLAYLTCVR